MNLTEIEKRTEDIAAAVVAVTVAVEVVLSDPSDVIVEGVVTS